LATNTDIDPDPDSTEWTELYYQDGKITHSIPNNYFQYNPIDEGDPLSVYRYVAVYSTYSKGLVISEVLVFGIGKFNQYTTYATVVAFVYYGVEGTLLES